MKGYCRRTPGQKQSYEEVHTKAERKSISSSEFSNTGYVQANKILGWFSTQLSVTAPSEAELTNFAYFANTPRV